MSTDTLLQGQKLSRDQQLTSRDGVFHAVMQLDGNFVVYRDKFVTWTSDTWKRGDYVILQEDGNLVIYDVNKTVTWASRTEGTDANRLVM
jgi:hypothetical protein